MARAPRRLTRLAAPGVGLVLAACAAAPVPKPAAAPAADPAPDWRSLPVLPWGSSLQDLTAAAHEVLMFGDLAGQECVALEEPSQRVAGQVVGSYVLCFVRGRLHVVELAVKLPAAQSAAEFARLCDQWQRGTTAISPRTPSRCDGALPQGPSFRAELALADSPEDPAVPLWITVMAPSGEGGQESQRNP